MSKIISVSSTCCDPVSHLNLKYDKVPFCAIFFYWTRIYPIDLTNLSPLSGENLATFPHVLESSWAPPVPNPILESQEWQSFCSLPTIPILALGPPHTTLNPSLLHPDCKDPWEPSSHFHVLRPSVVGRYCPSAISECRESACLFITTKLICWLTFIPRQILVKDVFQ